MIDHPGPRGDYQRLWLDTRSETPFDSYSAWIFHRSAPLHHGIITIGLLAASAKRLFVFSEEEYAMDNTIICTCVFLIVLRICADSGPLGYRKTTRHLLTALLIIPNIATSWAMAVQRRQMHPSKPQITQWVDFMCNYAGVWNFMFAFLLTSLGLSHPSIGIASIAVLQLAPLWLLGFLSEGLSDELAETRTKAYLGLAVSFMCATSGYYWIDRQFRALFELSKRERDASEEKGRKIAAISHDFGSPIAIMSMLLDSLERNKEAITHIGTSTLQALRAALQLLSVARTMAINLNKLERAESLNPERTICSIRQLLDDVKLVAEHMPKRVSVRLELSDELDEAGTLCLTDRGWLFLIMTNFLSNAFKNVSDGIVKLAASIIVDSGGNKMLRLKVADHGLGVSDELVSSLFQPYAQASRWRFGTGLGLYHVRELANALGGDAYHAHNTPSGAIFWVDVPFVAALERPDERSGSPTIPRRQADAQPLSVLLVDDDDMICDFTSVMFNQFLDDGSLLKLEVAHDGVEGLEKLTADGGHFDLALIDLQMPVMDGIECVRRLREEELMQPKGKKWHTRTVAVSANSDDAGVRAQCLVAGFDDVSAKPLSIVGIKRLLDAARLDTRNKAHS